MKRKNQKVILQEMHGGTHIWTGYRVVSDIENHGEYWTGQASVHGRKYEVTSTGQNTWYAKVETEHSELIHSLGAEIK